jgi:hypothetical protein
MVAAAQILMRDRKPKRSTCSEAKEPLQVRIPVTIKRAFKSAAALQGMEPNELFIEVWAHYERTKSNATPGKPTK